MPVCSLGYPLRCVSFSLCYPFHFGSVRIIFTGFGCWLFGCRLSFDGSVMHSIWASGKFYCQNSIVHPKFSPYISHSQGPLPSCPPLTKGIWVLGSFGLGTKGGHQPTPPPPATRHREIWFLADLDWAPKVGSWSPMPLHPPPPTRHREIWFLANLDWAPKVGSWSPTPPLHQA